MKKYSFIDIVSCEMCGDSTEGHTILGQRMNKSQGFRPKSNIGISVSIVQCTNCHLIYSNPQPIPFDIQDHYGTPPEEYWQEEYFTWTEGYFAHEVKTVKSLLDFKQGMTALDIGAGLGKAMLSLQAAGFDTFGLEPSIPFHERAISKMNINPDKLKLGAVEDLDYDKNSFDFITFGAVFEHLYEPAKNLEKALKWLKPNGIIQIEVPSSKWLMPKIMNLYFKLVGTNYVTNLSPMHTPFHLHEFDIKSFEALSKKLNFTITKQDYDVCTIYYVPKVLHTLLKWYMKKTNKGMQLIVYLKKN
ncbi:MAG: class I SAM-dependent methyltransferase [Flavobacteriales bacterium]|nr:class I SAM-dependent methyltransferase [Flavobacteriales bacterium]